MKNFTGTGVALVTPFAKNGDVDIASLSSLVGHVINAGVEYIVALGTTGETPTLEDQEKEWVLDTILQAVDKQVPVVCGIGGNDTAAVLRQMTQFQDKEIAGILSVVPYYNKPTQQGMLAHFKTIAAHTDKPIILYNVPGRTVSNILPSTVVELAKAHKNIVAIKEASGNMPQVMELVRIKPEGFTVLSGDDNLIVPQIAIGFEGVISVAANCYTQKFTNMVRAALSGDFTEARKLHYELLPAIDDLFIEGNPAGVKYVLSTMGLLENNLRLPLVCVSESLATRINNYVNQLT